MWKAIVLGAGLWATITQVGASSQSMEVAQVQPAPLVTHICQADLWWTEGFRIGEAIPLTPEQHHPARVIQVTPLRSGYGFEGPVMANLAAGSTVTVMGEVWDRGCNQWMIVPMNGGVSYIHGNALQNL